MIISDLNHLEVVNEAKVEGGDAYAIALAEAKAFGISGAAAGTVTYSEAISGPWFNLALSGSGSESVAG